MFTDEIQMWDGNILTFLTRDEADVVYATKSEIPTLTGGLDVHTADGRYAPRDGSTVYATQSAVALKASVTDVNEAFTDVAGALSLKADASHNHTGVYQPAGDYAAASHTHTGVYQPAGNYAPATGSTEYATKAEVTEATGGGLTQTAADSRYVQQIDLFQEVLDIGDQAYAPINGSTVYATKNEIPDVSGFVTGQELVDGLNDKAVASHNHDGVYQPAGDYAAASHTHDDRYPTLTDYNDHMAEWQMVRPADLTLPLDVQFAPRNAETGSNGAYAQIGHTHTGVYQPVGDYAATSHTHTGVYQPVGSYLVAADITGKANTDDVYTKTESDTKYQTKSNMVVVGAETTYYSGAKVDAIVATLGNSGTTTYATFYSPTAAQYVAAFPGNFGGSFWFHWYTSASVNGTPLTLYGFRNGTNGGNSTSLMFLQNQTANTYQIEARWELGSTAHCADATYGGNNILATWCQHIRGLPNNKPLTDADGPMNWAGTGVLNGVTYTANGIVQDCAYKRHDTSSAQMTMQPGDMISIMAWGGVTFTGNPYAVPSNIWLKTDGKLNRLQIRCWS